MSTKVTFNSQGKVMNMEDNTELPYDFDLCLDCKTMKDLKRLHAEATEVLETIDRLVQEYPEVYWDGSK